MKPGDSLVVEARELDALLDALRERGYTLIGPTVRDGAIVLDEIERRRGPAGRLDRRAGRRPLPPAAARATTPSSATPSGRTPGSATCTRRPSCAGAPAATNGGFVAEPETAPAAALAFVGVRACDLAAIAVQDRVFLGGPFVDPAYRARREARVRRRRELRRARRHLLLRVDGHRAAGRGRLRPRADRAPRTASATSSSSRSARERGRRASRRVSPPPGGRTPDLEAAAAAASRARPRAWAARSTTDGLQGAALPPLRAPALGRGRRSAA